MDDSLLFRINRSKKKQQMLLSLLAEGAAADRQHHRHRTRTPRTPSHQALAHLYPSHTAQDFPGADGKAKFGSYFTGHHKTQAQYLELHFTISQNGVVQENQSLLQIIASPPFSTSPNPNLEPAEMLQLTIKAEANIGLSDVVLSG